MSNGDHKTIDSLAYACRKADAEIDELKLTIRSLKKNNAQLVAALELAEGYPSIAVETKSMEACAIPLGVAMKNTIRPVIADLKEVTP